MQIYDKIIMCIFLNEGITLKHVELKPENGDRLTPLIANNHLRNCDKVRVIPHAEIRQNMCISQTEKYARLCVFTKLRKYTQMCGNP